MKRTQLTAALAAVVVFVGSSGLGLLISRTSQRSRAFEEAESSILDQAGRLVLLLEVSEERRAAILAAASGMNRVLTVGRDSDTVQDTPGEWEVARSLLDTAVGAASELSNIRAEIGLLASSTEVRAAGSRGLRSEASWTEFLDALNSALSSTKTLVSEYEQLDGNLLVLIALYQELGGETEEFLRKQAAGDFTSRSRASDWFINATNPALEELVEVRGTLEPIQEVVNQAKLETQKAFDFAQQRAGDVF